MQQVDVSELKAEEFTGPESGGGAQQHEALVAGGHRLGQRPHLLDRQGTTFFRGTAGSFASAQRLCLIMRSRTAARKSALAVLKTGREVLAASL